MALDTAVPDPWCVMARRVSRELWNDARLAGVSTSHPRQPLENREGPAFAHASVRPLGPIQIVAFLSRAIGTMRPSRIAYSSEPHRMRFEPKLASQTRK